MALRRHVFFAIRDADRAEFTSYQSCRRCKQRVDETPDLMLWKYSVRSYICSACRARVLAGLEAKTASGT